MNNAIQALEQDRVYMEEVARHNPLGLRRQELSPPQPRAAPCRLDAGPLEEQPHATRRDRVPEPGEFTLDASLAPRRVLSAMLRIRRRSSGAVEGRPGGLWGWVQGV